MFVTIGMVWLSAPGYHINPKLAGFLNPKPMKVTVYTTMVKVRRGVKGKAFVYIYTKPHASLYEVFKHIWKGMEVLH